MPSASGSTVTVANAGYNGALPGGDRTTFGFTATGPICSPPTLTCAPV
ncbi:hypothetical protein GVV04_04130 [Micromonospora sp. NEAU-HG-1]|nr:hypothetical protein [Micromonospora rubida]